MELEVMRPQKIKAKTIQVHVKVVDSGSYTLLDEAGRALAERNKDYVPCFFPGEHYGDYLILDIDLETGVIQNWQKPDPLTVANVFFPEEK